MLPEPHVGCTVASLLILPARQAHLTDVCEKHLRFQLNLALHQPNLSDLYVPSTAVLTLANTAHQAYCLPTKIN